MAEPEQFDVVVIGSGFGGTIAALTLANYYYENNAGKVCILERGQWWLSHETQFNPQNIPDSVPLSSLNMLEYLVRKKMPFNFWAHPDNIQGIFNILSMSKSVNKERGLYDFHSFSNSQINVITASAVGGGSMIYSNVTIRPDPSVYNTWPKEENELGLDEPFSDKKDTYFSIAENFIGVNKITTNAGLGGTKLERSMVFQEAAKKAKSHNSKPGEPKIFNSDDPVADDYSLNLSISDLPNKLFDTLTQEEINKYKNPIEANVCQRQARCNLGCIPGARHTMNKRLFDAVKSGKPLEIRPLCEVSKIEYSEKDKDYPYTVVYKSLDGKYISPIKTKYLIVSSGTLGSTELLLRSESDDFKFSKKLGHRFSTNADMLAYMKLNKKEIDITRGPINTSHAKFQNDKGEFLFNIEDTSIPPMVASLFATILEAYSDKIEWSLGLLQRLMLLFKPMGLSRKLSFKPKFGLSYIKANFKWFTNHSLIKELATQPSVIHGDPPQIIREQSEQTRKDLSPLYTFVNWLLSNKQRPFDSPAQRLSKFFVFSCMGIDSGDGILSLIPDNNSSVKKSRSDRKLELKWDMKKNAEAFSNIRKGVEQIAKEIEPESTVTTLGWNEGSPEESNLVLLHPLGGCSIGNSNEDGVVNGYGQVYKCNEKNTHEVYGGFYVVDGSIVPSALGVNPSLTISALAFRCVEKIISDLPQIKNKGNRDFWPK